MATSDGIWNAATGSSGGPDGEWQNWIIDLSSYAGQTIEVSISNASDFSVTYDPGVLVDNIAITNMSGDPPISTLLLGTTSFEDDDDQFDGWQALGAPEDSPINLNDWVLFPLTP